MLKEKMVNEDIYMFNLIKYVLKFQMISLKLKIKFHHSMSQRWESTSNDRLAKIKAETFVPEQYGR
jgi:hypothetical protein